jgi:hypothetical protein
MAQQQQPLTAASLIAAASAESYAVTSRSLELWRYRGLLPRPTRRPSGRAVWLYPAGTDRQLLRLLHWRNKTRRHEQIRIALWIEGFPIDLESVRGVLVDIVDAWQRALAADLPSGATTEDIASVIDAFAAKAAGMRGRSPIPRAARMTAAERSRAYGYLLSVVLGNEDELRRRKDDVVLAERLLGLRRGHGDGMAAMIPLDAAARRVARLPTPAEARDVIASATAEEFELVRRFVQVFVIWLPILAPILLVNEGDKARDLLKIAGSMFSEQAPEVFPYLIVALLISLHAKALGSGELVPLIAALAPGRVDLDLLSELPPNERGQALRQLPAERAKILGEGLKTRRAGSRDQTPADPSRQSSR